MSCLHRPKAGYLGSINYASSPQCFVARRFADSCSTIRLADCIFPVLRQTITIFPDSHIPSICLIRHGPLQHYPCVSYLTWCHLDLRPFSPSKPDIFHQTHFAIYHDHTSCGPVCICTNPSGQLIPHLLVFLHSLKTFSLLTFTPSRSLQLILVSL